MLKKSQDYNPNYLAKIVKLPAPVKHPNADKLQIFTIDFQGVISDMSAKEGDIYVYFPLECSINKDFISFINGFSNPELNKDKEIKGFFDKNARVRAVRLRGTPSQGFIIPIEKLQEWLFSKIHGIDYDSSCFNNINLEFDSWDNIRICEKYVIISTQEHNGINNKKNHRRFSRILEKQFEFHNNTENLRKNIDKISPDDFIGIHYKKHGTSFVVANILTNKRLTWKDKLAKVLGVSVNDKIYDIVYSSRKVIKNEYETQNSNHYYNYDLWKDVKDQIGHLIPKGWTLYGEAIGYTRDGGYIQKDFDYGCRQNEMKIYIYRITVTNPDGYRINLDDRQIEEFCLKNGLLYKDTFLYYGKAEDLYTDLNINEQWHQSFLERLQEEFNDKNCWMCVNKVPEEGIVLRKQSLFDYEAYKLKSFRFLEKETKELDSGSVDIENSQN